MHREVPQEKQQSALGIQRRQTVEAKSKHRPLREPQGFVFRAQAKKDGQGW